MNKHIFILLALLLSFTSQVQSQDLLMKTVVYKDGTGIKWLPMRPTLWDSLSGQPASLTRVTIDSLGKAIPSSEVQFSTLQLKDSTWWVQNGARKNGVFEAIGSLLYDPKFKSGGKKMNPQEVSYNYVIYEAEADNRIADGLGLFYLDTTAREGKTYQYTVKLGGLTQTIVSDIEQGYTTQNPSGVQLRFKFPNGQSLSQMSGILDEVKLDIVHLIGRAYEDSIVLRWAPNHPEFWFRTNQSGYTLTRVDDLGNMDTLGKFLPTPEKEIDPGIVKDTFALVAVQMLYGKGMNANVTGLYDQASIFENKFSFSLYSAERSSTAANILGLRYVDYEVEKGKSYQYYLATTASEQPYASTNLSIENTFVPEPPPSGLETETGDKVISVKWDRVENSQRFNSYWLERSADGGKTYVPVSSRPILFLENDSVQLPKYKLVDSVRVNDQEFTYRLRGFNSFTEMSAPSTATGIARDLLPPPKPFVHYGETSKDLKTMEIRWKNFVTLPEDFDHYAIQLGEDGFTGFDSIAVATASDTSFTMQIPEDGPELVTHYFRVVAYDRTGNQNASEPRYVSYPDRIAPDPPQGLVGEITEEGVVKIYWDHNTEKDLAGYWVYTANDPDDEFSPAITKMTAYNSFIDTIQTVSLSEKIYYVVEAEDAATNRGLPSEVLELKRPDKVPPIAPLLRNPEEVEERLGILLKWAYSPSSDVVGYQLYKRTAKFKDGGEWQYLKFFKDPSINTYLDTAIVFDVDYEYRLRAIDDASLVSEYCTPVRGKLVFRQENLEVPEVQVSYERGQATVAWKYGGGFYPPNATSYKFRVYRSTGARQLVALKDVSADTLEFVDSDMEQGGLYNYAVSVVFDTGHESPMSIVRSVLYE